MKDFSSCLCDNAVQVADASCSSAIKIAENMVTCIYQCILLGKSCFITITWSKNLVGQNLGVQIEDSSNSFVCKFDIKPWVFFKRKGSKESEVNSSKIELHWDFSLAKFGSGPEPLKEFYLAVVSNGKMALLIGDMKKEAFRKINIASPVDTNSAIFISKREHIFSKKVFSSKAQFCDHGQVHKITIECDTPTATSAGSGSGSSSPCLVIRVDGKVVVQVKRLLWKFRGNQTILVDGLPVEVFWDVHNWLFGAFCAGSAVFMFQTCFSAEKLWSSQTITNPFLSPWHYCAEKNCGEAKLQQHLGFSLILCAWKIV